MKNKGFTLVELLSVIVILGVLSSLAVVGVGRYRKEVSEKELVNLHSTIEASYDKYRTDALMKGKSANSEIKFGSLDDVTFNKYFSEFTYDGKRLTKADLSGSVFKLVIKGELLKLMGTDLDTDQLVTNGICLVESKIGDDSESEKATPESWCKTDKDGNPIPSKEEMLCIKLIRKDEVLIDDFSDKQSLCRYFSEGYTPTTADYGEEVNE